MRILFTHGLLFLSLTFASLAQANPSVLRTSPPSSSEPPAQCPDTGLKVGLVTSDEKVVPPVCFEALAVQGLSPRAVDTKNCEKDSGLKIVGTATSEGYVQSRYEMEGLSDLGIIMYRKIGSVADGDVVQTLSYSGGSGHFSEVFVVTLEGTKLTHVRSIAAGDRCNNGITDVTVKDGKILISQNITPIDFITLATGSEQNLKAYEDLEASAASCFAVATVDESGALTRVQFDKDVLEGRDAEWVARFGLQACFDKLFQQSLVEEKFAFDKTSFQSWVQNFLKTCKK